MNHERDASGAYTEIHPGDGSTQRAHRSQRYVFAEVRAALCSHWGLSLHRGGEMSDGMHDGRWDTAYSRTGYVLGGQLPGLGYGYRRFATLADVVATCDLAVVIERGRLDDAGRASGGRR